MTNARPAHCTITLHTSEGMNTFLTEDLVPDSDKDMTDPQTVSTALGARLSNNGRITYTARGGVETVFAHALLRMSVTPESQEPGSTTAVSRLVGVADSAPAQLGEVSCTKNFSVF